MERRQERLLDLIQGDALAGNSMLKTLESPRDLTNAPRGILVGPLSDGIVIDNGPEHQRVVGVQPERDLLRGRRGVE